MRKLGRLLRRLLTAVSLLLFVAVLAAWVLSYFKMGVVRFAARSFDEKGWRQNICRAGWSRGDLWFDRVTGQASAKMAGEARGLSGKADHIPNGSQSVWESEWESHPVDISNAVSSDAHKIALLGATFFYSEGWGSQGDWFVRHALLNNVFYSRTSAIVPCWMGAIVFGALPSWRCFVWWRVRRRVVALREGRCAVCGYDLRASPERCPECGTAVGELQKREARSEKREEKADIEPFDELRAGH